MNPKNPTPLVCALLAACTLIISAQTVITVGGAGATNDVTKASSWTTNNTVYDGTNGGSAMHWENVTTNTATPDGTDSFFDVTWGTSGTGYNIGRVYMYNNGDTAVDLATLNAEGITSIAWDVEFNASNFTNWYPVIAVTDAGTTTYYILQGNHTWDWNGNGPHDFTSKTDLANNDIWLGILPVNDGTDLGNIIDVKDPSSNPNIRRARLDYDTATTSWILGGSPPTGTVDFGVMQWGGSGSGGVTDPTAFTTEFVSFEVVVTSETTPDPDFYIGGGTANATPDVTDVTNWKTNNVDYIQDAMVGTNDGYALNWENVTTNTAAANGTTHFDGGMLGGPNVTIGRLYMYTAESVDLSTLTNGVTRLSMVGDFETSTGALDHWIPVMAITDGGVTRYYRSSNAGNLWKTNSAQEFFDGTEVIAGSDFAGLKAEDGTTTTIDNTRDTTLMPVLRPEYVWDIPTQMYNLEGSPSGVATFGFIQWTGGSGTVNTVFTTAIDSFTVYGYSDAGDIVQPPAPLGITAAPLASNDFTYHYEMDAVPSSLDLDLDPNSGADWRDSWEPNDIFTIPGVALNDNTNANNLFRTDQADTINRATVTGDVTVEVRLRVKEKLTGYAATGLAGNQPGASGSLRYLVDESSVALNEGDDIQAAGDNTDGFHTYRFAWVAADNKYWCWRDDVLVYGGTTVPGGGIDPTSGTLSGAGAWWFGDYTSGFGGFIEYDYIRVHNAAVAPLLTTFTGSTDGDWDTSTTNWDQGSGAIAYTNGDEAVFPDGAATGALTLSGTIEPGAVSFTNNSLAYTLAGSGIGGTTSLQVIGGGTVTLNNVNTYTGITEVAVGSLTVGSGGEIGESTVLVRDNATLTVASGGAIGISNVIETTTRIQSGGTLVVDAGGTLGITNTTVTSGASLVANGTVGDDGDQYFVTVNDGGSISGNGTIKADLLISGTVSPGTSIGTLTGEYIVELGGGSTYTWELSKWTSAVAGTDYDQVVADEIDLQMSAGDPMTIVITPDSIPDFDDSMQTFVIATATSGVFGTFDADAFVVDDSAFETAHPTANSEGWSIAQDGNNLELSYSSATAYDIWAVTDHGLQNPWLGVDPSLNGEPGADPDGDGKDNFYEFAFDGDPNDPADNGKTVLFTNDGADDKLVLTIALRAGTPGFTGAPSPSATHDGVIYTVQGSTDLVDFTTGVSVVGTPVITDLPAPSAGYEYRSFSLDGSTDFPAKGFLQAVAEEAP